MSDDSPLTGTEPPSREGRRRPSSRTRRGRRAPEPPDTGAAAEDSEPDPHEVARTIALRKLTAAPQSRAMLAEAMAKKNVPEDVAEQVLDRFTEVGLVDDAEYAAMLVRTRHSERHLARRALAQELHRKGIDRDLAAEALAQVDDGDELDAARQLGEKKARSMRGLEPQVARRRLVGALARRGFGADVVRRVFDEVLADHGDDLDDIGSR